jgi:hypothetical protein
MQEIGLVAVYATVGAFLAAMIVAIVWLGGRMLLDAFHAYFLSPALEIVRFLGKTKSGR